MHTSEKLREASLRARGRCAGTTSRETRRCGSRALRIQQDSALHLVRPCQGQVSLPPPAWLLAGESSSVDLGKLVQAALRSHCQDQDERKKQAYFTFVLPCSEPGV